MSSLFFLSVSHLWNFLINWLLLWTSPKIKKIQLIWQLLLDILLISWLGTPGKTLPKVIVLDATFLWWLSLCQIFEISIDIDDQRTLQSDWTRGTTVHTHPKAVVSGATFPWGLSPCKKFKILIDSFQKYSWSKNPAIWLGDRENCPHPIKSGSLRYYLPLMNSSMQKKLR